MARMLVGMAKSRPARHRIIVLVDVEAFGRPDRTDLDRKVVRAGLYRLMEQSVREAGIPWGNCRREDRGDGIMLLAPAEVPGNLFVEALPSAVLRALTAYNHGRAISQRLRLRMAISSGQIYPDGHGVGGMALIHAYRLLEAAQLRETLSGSRTLALITSSAFFDEVIRHGPAALRNDFFPVRVTQKETDDTAWIRLPDGRRPARSSLAILSPALCAVLQGQHQAADELPYRLLSAPQPDLSQIYVEQRAQRDAAPDVAKPRAHRKAVHGKYGKPDLHSQPETDPGHPVVRSVPEILRAERHLLVLGEPGVGKSTLLRHLTGESAKWWLSPPVGARPGDGPCGAAIPVRLSASALTAAPWEETLATGLTAELGARLDRTLSAALFAVPPSMDADWLVLIDGLDEILDAPQRKAVIGVLAQRLRQADGAAGRFRLLITSRPLPDHELAPLRRAGVSEWRLRPFGRHDLETFARRWFGAQGREREAEKFLAEVERANLQAITRIPLLATITAVVYEQGALPVGLATLYEEFLRYLLQVRQETVRARAELREHLARYTSEDAKLADWLFANLRRLLEFLATEELAGRDAPLTSLARSWVAERHPALPRLVPDWGDRVTDLLRSSGVVLQDAQDLRFLHRSFAEYLAADPAAATRDAQAWCRDIVDPTTRNRTLFALARWSADHDLSAVVDRLLARPEDHELLAAAEVLAHGIPLSAAAENLIIDTLLARAQGTSHADYFSALGTLAGRPAVTAGLAGLMADPKVPAQVRVEAARTHGSLTDPSSARSTLRALARDPLRTAGERVLAARALGELGEPAEAADLLTAFLHDRAVPAADRIQAADQLILFGHRAPVREVLLAIATDPGLDGHERVQAAKRLGDVAGPHLAAEVLTTIMYEPGTRNLPRMWAAREVARLGRRDMAIDVLVAVAVDPERLDFTGTSARKQLAESGIRLARGSGTNTFERIQAARKLAELGETDLARTILTMLARHRLSTGNQVQAAMALAEAGDRDTAASALIRLAHDRLANVHERLGAAHALDELGEKAQATRAFERLTREIHLTTVPRIYAAHALALRGSRSQAMDVLGRLLRSWRHTHRTQAEAAHVMAELGERERAGPVLLRIAHSRLALLTVRADAARYLAELGERDAALPVLKRIALSRYGNTVRVVARIEAAKALAELGERELALPILHRYSRTKAFGQYAADRLAELGEREPARQTLANVIADRRTKPEARLSAAQYVCRHWSHVIAVELLRDAAGNPDMRAWRRVRAATDVARVAGREPAVDALKAIRDDAGSSVAARWLATARLIQWKLL